MAVTMYAFIILHCFWFDGQIVCDVAYNSATLDPPKTYASEADCYDVANIRVQWGGPDTGTWRSLCFQVTAAKVPAT